MKLIITVTDLCHEACFIQALKDTVDGYFGDIALDSNILESGTNNVMLIPDTQQKEEDIQGFGVR